jgi:hypothetical protein
MVTGLNGQYNLSLTPGLPYTVSPSKANDSVTNNGITTLDLVLMQRHILLQDSLNSPYKILAADVNNSGSVTTLDIVLTRTVILQTNLTFPGGRLWSMVDADHAFANPYAPWPFPSTRTYASASTAMNQDFYGVKLGDVNWSWNPATAKTDTEGEVDLVIGRAGGEVGDKVRVPVSMRDMQTLAGYQFALGWDPDMLGFEGISGSTDLPEAGLSRASEGILTLSWHEAQGNVKQWDAGAPLFYLEFRVRRAGDLPIGIADGVMSAEAYNEALQVMRVRSGGAEAAGAEPVELELSCHPNPFQHETTVRFKLAQAGDVRFVVADLQGHTIRAGKLNGQTGMNDWTWDGRDDAGRALASGHYVLRLESPGATGYLKLVLLGE